LAQKIISSPQQILFEENQSVLWCQFEDNRPFTECKWTIPRGESCIVGPDSPECSVENMVHFIGDSNNCSIRIDKVQNDENGEWKCELTDDQSIKSESSILMTIANKASVDFKEFFGTVTSVADQEFDITCEAEKSRPPGKFSWRIELASSEIINLENDLSPKEKPGANGFYRTEETLRFTPRQEYNEGKLFCSYAQTDLDGNLLYDRNEQHQQLNVIYLSEPFMDQKDIGEVEPSMDINITLEFGAHPKPRPQDVVWVFKNDIKTIEVPTEENTVAEKNHYLAYPIERIQENVYSATLTISNIGSNEADYQHFLQIRHPDIESPKDHWFTININGRGSPDQELPKGQNTGTIIIVVLVLLALVAIIAGALIFYSKKNDLWCFAPEESTNTKDPEIQKPLQTQGLNEPPIVKAGYRRPTEL